VTDQQHDAHQPQAPDGDKADSVARIVAVMAELGTATAGHIAEQVGVAYSTTTAKLRALEADGAAEKVRSDDRRTLWRLTPGGQPGTATDEPVEDTTAGAGINPDTDLADDGDRGGVPATEDEGGAAHANVSSAPPASDPDPPAADDTPMAQPMTADPAPDPSPGVETQSEAGPSAAAGTRAGTDPPSSTAGAAGPRRRQGELRGQVLEALQARPDDTFGATQLSRLLGGASQGAIANALHKLVTDGSAQQIQDKPARWQAV
jgi:DNA-binding HxlR family transcriptional regulator